MRNYKNIIAYRLADDFVLVLYKATKDFPREETYGLTSQLRRAAISITANIVEGASRQHKRDYLNFLFISRASAAEVECLLSLSYRLGYLEKAEFDKLVGFLVNISKTLSGLIDSVRKEV